MDAERLADLALRGAVDLVETFTSIQGEGPRMGERHLFTRFVHCDIHCAYCDTPRCHALQAAARVEQTPGRRDYREVPNPIEPQALAELVSSRLAQVRHHAVAITGGEPLLQPWAVRTVGSAARKAGVRVLLETDGNLPDPLADVIDLVDVLSLDWKLPSATGEAARYEEHRRCLELSRGRECYVKAVFTVDSTCEEISLAARAIAEIRPGIPLILQPCTPCGRVSEPPPPAKAVELQAAAMDILEDVRVMPQVHPILGLP